MAPKRSKNQLRREKAKLRKLQAYQDPVGANLENGTEKSPNTGSKDVVSSGEVNKRNESAAEPQKETPEAKQSNRITGKEKGSSSKGEDSQESPNDGEDQVKALPDKDLANEFEHIFARFEQPREQLGKKQLTRASQTYNLESSDLVSSDEDSEEEHAPISKRQRRKMNKVSIAELKASSENPNAVAWYDADAPDPYMNIAFKTCFNAIGVPSHWLQKKDYLSGKKGFELLPFKLPKFIQDTGIAEMRNYDPDTLKKQQRDRVQPKMGKLDIDYQKLHDAFFKYQTKSRYLKFGELYFEGREKADQHRESVIHMRPGVVSKRLREAVGLSANDLNSTPPWVTLMSLIGKPPVYKHCIIPGVDTVYNNNGYRTDSAHDLGLLDGGAWGAFEKDEESEYEESDEDDNESGSDENISGNDGGVSDNEDEADEPEKVDITEFSRYSSVKEDDLQKENLGPLYKILKEKKVPTSSVHQDHKAEYEMSGEEGSVTGRTETEERGANEDDYENFEF